MVILKLCEKDCILLQPSTHRPDSKGDKVGTNGAWKCGKAEIVSVYSMFQNMLSSTMFVAIPACGYA
jgi:hypothetical protein